MLTVSDGTSRKPERYSLMSIIIDRFDLPETREKSALPIGCISPCCVNVENLLLTNPGKSLLKLIYRYLELKASN